MRDHFYRRRQAGDDPHLPTRNAAPPARDPSACSLDLAQVVLDLTGRQDLEDLVRPDDANLDVCVIHRPLEALLQCQERRVHGVLELKVVVVPLLKEGLRIDEVLPNRRRLPGKVRARGIDLKELRAVVVEAGEEDRDAKGTNATALREFLHHGRQLADQHGDRDHLTIHAVVCLGCLSPLAAKHPEVGSHPGVDHRNIFCQHHDLLHALLIDQDRWELLLRGDHNTILRLHPK
mmetsp:Transcript_28058/g.71737  ORF Transcript_28058/g.71737 Transcript_28058/m.71737 type:complete len:234 (-) Transcript_28058:184-885(-)